MYRSRSYDVQQGHREYDNPVMASFSDFTEDIVPSRAPQKPAHVFVIEDNADPVRPSSRRPSERSTNRPESIKFEEPKKIFISYWRLFLLVVLVVLLILIVAILAGFAQWREVPGEGRDTGPTVATTLDPSIPYHRPRLPENIKPSRYDLNFKIEPSTNGGNFSGSVSIQAKCTENTQYIILHVSFLTIDAVQVSVTDQQSNRNMDIKKQFEFDRLQYYVIEMEEMLTADTDYVISIGDFRGNIQSDLMGLYMSPYKDSDGDSRHIIATQFSPFFARKLFPCFDEPSMKAVFKVTVNHPLEYDVLSNTPTDVVHPASSGWQTSSFMETPIMPTYVVGIVLLDGGYEYRQRTSNNGFQTRVWARSDVIDQMDLVLDIVDRSLTYFAETFGREEELTKSDNVALPTHLFAAMENWGLITYSERIVLFDANTSPIKRKLKSALTTAHECAHMWFGNLVTMNWWSDVWLKEGFATHSMYTAVDNLEPSWQVMDIFAVEVVLYVMSLDGLVTSHPLSTPGLDDVNEIFANFDWLAYYKGVSVLRMLEKFLGETPFKLGVQNYLGQHKFSNADMSDLWKEFSKVSIEGLDINHIMDTWTLQEGFPVVTVNKTTNEISGSRSLLVTQNYYLLRPKGTKINYNKSQFRYKWDIPFTYITGNSNSRTVQLHWMNMDSVTIPLASDSDNTWILGNVDLAGFYRVNYDLENWNRIIDQLQNYHEVFSSVNRAAIISDAFALQRAGLLDTDTALRVTLYLDGEFEYEPWYAAIEGFNYLKNRLYLSPIYGTLQRYVTRLIHNIENNVGWQVRQQPEDSIRRQLLRTIVLQTACDYGSTECIRMANEKFLSYRQTNEKVQGDIALVVFAVGISNEDAEVWNDLWARSQNANVDESTMMRLALAHSRIPWILERYMKLCLNTSIINPSNSFSLFGEIGKNPYGQGVAMDFIVENWQDIQLVYGSAPVFIQNALSAAQLINSEADLQLLTDLKQETEQNSPAYGALLNIIEEVKINVEWKTDYELQVHNFFESDAAQAKM
ncbi:aminopeptidase N-like [Glandiceps talaboti]